MPDDRHFENFRLLDAPIEPDAAYAEEMFEDLAFDLGFRPSILRNAVAGRLAWRWPALRLPYLVAILALLALAAVAAAALVGSQFQHVRTVAEIVAASEATHLHPPAYDMTIRSNDIWITRVRMDGHGAWRWDLTPDPNASPATYGDPGLRVGSYHVHAGGRVGHFERADNTWTVSADDVPIANASLLGWSDHLAATQPSDLFNCSNWLRLPDEVIAGRPAYHVACDKREFWIDEASSLLVGLQAPSGLEVAGVTGFATALSLVPSFAADTFSLTGPVGAQTIDPTLHSPSPNTILVIGQAPPRLTATTLDGKVIDTAKEAGPLVVFFWASWCAPCLGPQLTDLQAVASRYASSVSTVTITQDDLDAVKTYVHANDVLLPVVNDGDSTLIRSWGIGAFPALVMIDPDGRVSALARGPVAFPDLERMYAALSAGEPIPTPSPSR